MTTIRLTPRQKRTLESARKVIEAHRGRRVSRGAAVAVLAEFALERRADLAASSRDEDPPWIDDPLLDPDFGFHFGRTDAKSIDKLLYGGK